MNWFQFPLRFLGDRNSSTFSVGIQKKSWVVNLHLILGWHRLQPTLLLQSTTVAGFMFFKKIFTLTCGDDGLKPPPSPVHLGIFTSWLQPPMAAHEMCWSFDDGIPRHLRLARADEGRCGKFKKWKLMVLSRRKLHPGRLTWNLQIIHLERNMIFQTSMIMFHVNLEGCTVDCWWLKSGDHSPVEVCSLSTIIYMVS